MRWGEIILFLLFNTVIIFGLYHWQTRLLTKKMARIKHEIQELEDLVVAMVEELGEAVTDNQDTSQLANQEKLKPQSNPVLSVSELSAVSLDRQAKLKPGLISEQLTKVELTTDPAMDREVISVQKQGGKVDSIGEQSLPVITDAKGEESVEQSAVQSLRLKINQVSGQMSEAISTAESNLKSELIPPPKPKAKRTSAKSTPMASSSNNPILSQTRAATVNSVAKSTAPTKVSNTKQQKVLNLARQGLEVAEIAKQLKMGQGEIQLILGLYKEN